jgi:hypothetical protein
VERVNIQLFCNASGFEIFGVRYECKSIGKVVPVHN